MTNLSDIVIADTVDGALKELALAAVKDDRDLAVHATRKLETVGITAIQVDAVLLLCQAEVDAGFNPIISWEVKDEKITLSVSRGRQRESL